MLLVDLDEALDKGITESEASIILDYVTNAVDNLDRKNNSSATYTLANFTALLEKEGDEVWRVTKISKNEHTNKLY